MPKTFLFYDIETSGLNPAFDQIIQFAAIRTDMNLHELERYEWIVRPNPDTIPSPMAMIIHRTPITLWQQGEPELVVIKRIHDLFNAPGTVSIGYNTLGFDDEFLRFSFYRNLLAPYTHQYANACSRADLYPITALYYLFHENSLKWPLRNQKISLKLEALNEINQLATGAAHTAIIDIEATIALAKKFMNHADTWQYALGYFEKEKDDERNQKLPQLLEKKHAVMVDGIFGAALNFCAPVLHLGTHYHFKNQSCWLRLDSEHLSHSTSDDFIQHNWVINKKLAEPGFLLPPTEKYLNKLNSHKKELLKKNVAWLEKNPNILAAMTQHYCDFTYPKYPDIAPEAALYYQGFWNNEQQQQSQQFHRTPPKKKSAVIDTISHPLLKTLAIHALARLDSDLLSEEQREEYENHVKKCKQTPEKIIDYKGKQKLGLKQALEEVQTLKNDTTLDQEQFKLLYALEEWLLNKLKLNQNPAIC
jgi:exodeoxyribonuclease-1